MRLKLDNLIVILIILGTIVFLIRAVETFSLRVKSEPDLTNNIYDTEMERYLKSLNMHVDWRNAYLRGGGNPLREISPRTFGGKVIPKPMPKPKMSCNYPIKDKVNPPFFY